MSSVCRRYAILRVTGHPLAGSAVHLSEPANRAGDWGLPRRAFPDHFASEEDAVAALGQSGLAGMFMIQPVYITKNDHAQTGQPATEGE